MRNRYLLYLFFCTSVVASLLLHSNLAAATQARVTLRLILVLKDHSLRPVPRHLVEFILSSDVPSQPSEPTRVTTGFDGTATALLSVGSYRVVVQNAVEVEGRRFSWDVPVSIAEGQVEVAVDLSNDNATVTSPQERSGGTTAEGRIFSDCKDGVVTVEAEGGHGSGFVVDSAGLVLTNAHVVQGSREFVIAFDGSRRFIADRLAVDGDNDIAVLRFNPAAFPKAHALPLALSSEIASIRPGDPVVAIGSPLHQDKILTRGIVSKVEDGVILSDVNINHGNSGGPLLDLNGVVIGITTFKDLDPTGGGVSGIVRITLAGPLLEKAREVAASKDLPDINPLPSMPDQPFPLSELKSQIQSRTYDPTDYGMQSWTFDVQFMTPALKYFLRTKEEAEKAAIRLKKQKKAGEALADPDADPYANLRSWGVYVGEYQPVVELYMLPRLKATVGSAFAAVLTGVSSALSYRYKSDFDKAELVVDGNAITPIRKSRVTRESKFVSSAGSANDSAYAGVYLFSADFLKDVHAGSVASLVIHDGLKPEKPTSIKIDTDLLLILRDDLAPILGPSPFPRPEPTSALPLCSQSSQLPTGQCR